MRWGLRLGSGLGGLKVDFGKLMFRRPPRFWPRTSAPAERKDEEGEVWLWLKDRVEQSGFFFNSASRPLACCNHQSWGAIGEEGLGFWALKSEKERG